MLDKNWRENKKVVTDQKIQNGRHFCEQYFSIFSTEKSYLYMFLYKICKKKSKLCPFCGTFFSWAHPLKNVFQELQEEDESVDMQNWKRWKEHIWSSMSVVDTFYSVVETFHLVDKIYEKIGYLNYVNVIQI